MHKGVRGEQGGGGKPEFSPFPFPFYCLPCRLVMNLSTRDTRLFLGNATNKSASGCPIGTETNHCNQGRQ